MRYVRKEYYRVHSVFVATCDAHHRHGGYIKHIRFGCLHRPPGCLLLPARPPLSDVVPDLGATFLPPLDLWLAEPFACASP